MAQRTEINRKLPPGIDGRSKAAMRWKELVRGYEQAFIVADELDDSLIAVAATLTITLEEKQAARLRGEAVDSDLLSALDRLHNVVSHLTRRPGSRPPPLPTQYTNIITGNDDDEEDDD